MRALTRTALTTAVAATLALTGCSSGGDTGGRIVSTRACVIMPETDSSPRWEESDRPAIERALDDAGLVVASRNAEGNLKAYAAHGKELLEGGCGVMLLADLRGAASEVAAAAKAQQVPVIAYDRPFAGADYLISLDYASIGRKQAEAMLNALAARGVDPAGAVVYLLAGDENDPTAADSREGARAAFAEAGVTLTKDFAVAGGESRAAEMLDVQLKVTAAPDAVWAGSDGIASGALAALEKNGLSAIVTGQDATVVGLRNVVLGKQLVTIFKPNTDEARKAATIAIDLLSGRTPTTDGELDDGTPYLYVDATVVDVKQVADVIRRGAATVKDVCAAEVASACAAQGITG